MPQIFLSLNYYSFLILIFAMLSFIFRKKLKKKEFLFNLSCIACYFFISTVNNLKYIGYYSSRYEIFSDIFLMLAFCNFGRFFLKNKVIIFLPILFAVIYLNLKDIKYYIEIWKVEYKDINRIKSLCEPEQTYFYDYHKRLDKKQFQEICQNL